MQVNKYTGELIYCQVFLYFSSRSLQRVKNPSAVLPYRRPISTYQRGGMALKTRRPLLYLSVIYVLSMFWAECVNMNIQKYVNWRKCIEVYCSNTEHEESDQRCSLFLRYFYLWWWPMNEGQIFSDQIAPCHLKCKTQRKMGQHRSGRPKVSLRSRNLFFTGR